MMLNQHIIGKYIAISLKVEFLSIKNTNANRNK
jgi:hypothetical protein